MFPNPIYLPSTTSTNDYLSELCAAGPLPDLSCVYTSFQQAGRGQRGNSWESEAGKNLLFSFVVFPSFLEIKHQFLLAEITALALQEVLSGYAEGIRIKWPNDIYWHDRKLCGTLIENDWTGSRVSRSISGSGVNLNQERFVSNAPNPVSLYQITGRRTEPADVLAQLLARIEAYYTWLKDGGGAAISQRYQDRLYRREGLHPYRDAQGGFEARIAGVATNGQLTLEDTGGQHRLYYFKEVEYVL